MILHEIRKEIERKKKKVVIQSPKLEILDDPSFQARFKEDVAKYSEYLRKGQIVSSQSLYMHFNV